MTVKVESAVVGGADEDGGKLSEKEYVASKRKGVIIQEPEKTTTIKTASSQQYQVQDKGKGIAKLIEEPVKLKKKDQILFDEEEDIQAKVDADYQFAERLQAEEQEQLTDAKKAKLFMEFIEKRRKLCAAKRTTKKRNKPPTKAQQRSIMSTYLKNMDGWKPRALKNKSFAEIKELFNKAMERINNFIDFRTELVDVSTKKYEADSAQESSSKRAEDELDQERSKKQKVEDDKEFDDLKKCLEIVPDDGDDVTIDVTHLSSSLQQLLITRSTKKGRRTISKFSEQK
nr:hypothetical protein [Tanacetum cinerariifolium]